MIRVQIPSNAKGPFIPTGVFPEHRESKFRVLLGMPPNKQKQKQ